MALVDQAEGVGVGGTAPREPAFDRETLWQPPEGGHPGGTIVLSEEDAAKLQRILRRAYAEGAVWVNGIR